jgi:mannose-6-phosphate isomerase-like protein (cupin superfamily)
MKTVIKPWGREIWLAHNDKYAGKELWIDAGKRLSKQYHEKKHETIFVISGSMLVELENEVIELGEHRPLNHRCLEIPPKTVHRFMTMEEGVLLIEFSTPELDDVVRLEDDYGRC